MITVKIEMKFCYLNIQANNGHLKAFFEILNQSPTQYEIRYYFGDSRIEDKSARWIHKSEVTLCDESDVHSHMTRYKYDYC